jgi:hypothetical protein
LAIFKEQRAKSSDRVLISEHWGETIFSF